MVSIGACRYTNNSACGDGWEEGVCLCVCAM